MSGLLLALDQGTTSSRAVVVDATGRFVGSAQREFAQHFPRPGWVEHDPEDIWRTQRETAVGAIRAAGVRATDIVAVGITNQRETVVVWERSTGRPIAPAIVWQDRRTAEVVARLKAEGHEPEVSGVTGLLLDPYFSATKIAWILDHVPGARERAERGELAAGTIDSWLLWKLTDGAVHATDVTNASRTQLMDLGTLEWHEGMLRIFRVPRGLLPDIRSCDAEFGRTAAVHLGAALPVRAMVGDQQAALFGQRCERPGMAKNTFGTGCFMLMQVGEKVPRSRHRLLATVGWRRGGSTASYALEGSTFVGGSAVQWLRDGLGIIRTAAEVNALAAGVPDSGGVVMVPAFTGLGAPHWDPAARGTILGLTRGSTAAHLARATLEGIAQQVADLMEAMQADAGRGIDVLRVDGGASASDLLMQMQADLIGIPVHRPAQVESTACGAAYMAGLAAGVWRDASELEPLVRIERIFEPAIDAAARQQSRVRWRRAVERSKEWETQETKS